MSSDRVYRDMKVFVEGDDGKKRPVTIGYAYEDGDKLRFQITALPPPGARTNWSGLIEQRDQKPQGQQTQQRGGSRPAFGGHRDDSRDGFE
jgi:hypothetical protein